ncbi:hypothetical protein J3E72DRAFT_430790 [Bipolaris maydis]|nr:hypothetical protein J3E72DRAFT_430790 [Bipolaris maydis]
MDLIEREYPTSDDKPPWYGMVFKHITRSSTPENRFTALFANCSTVNSEYHEWIPWHVGGERDKYRNSRGASSTPQRDTRPVSDSAALTVNATNEHRRQTQAPQNSRELSYELKSSLQTVSVATPVTVSGSPSPHWVQDTQESAQSELSGYVPASITSKHYSVYSDATIESTIDPQLLDMNYRDPVVFTEANGAFPMSLTPRTTPSRSFYSKNTSSEFCSPVQGYHQDMTNPSQPNPRFYISP